MWSMSANRNGGNTFHTKYNSYDVLTVKFEFASRLLPLLYCGPAPCTRRRVRSSSFRGNSGNVSPLIQVVTVWEFQIILIMNTATNYVLRVSASTWTCQSEPIRGRGRLLLCPIGCLTRGSGRGREPRCGAGHQCFCQPEAVMVGGT